MIGVSKDCIPRVSARLSVVDERARGKEKPERERDISERLFDEDAFCC